MDHRDLAMNFPHLLLLTKKLNQLKQHQIHFIKYREMGKTKNSHKWWGNADGEEILLFKCQFYNLKLSSKKTFEDPLNIQIFRLIFRKSRKA